MKKTNADIYLGIKLKFYTQKYMQQINVCLSEIARNSMECFIYK